MELEYLIVVLPPVIAGINEALKRAGMPSRFCPLIGVVLGILVCLSVAIQYGIDPILWGLVGAMIGLSASGLYEVTRDHLPKRPQQSPQ